MEYLWANEEDEVFLNSRAGKSGVRLIAVLLAPLLLPVGCASVSLPLWQAPGASMDSSGNRSRAMLGADSPKERKQGPFHEALPALDLEESHPLVKREHRKLSSSRSRFVRTALQNGNRYLPRVQKILRDFGLPKELVGVAVIESQFRTFARSRAGAVGVWQFMPTTARAYGLRVSRSVDERLSPLRATVAAAHLLRDLHRQFGDWKLALAAYNAGPSRVNRGIRKVGSRDFWLLSKKRQLPPQTRAYIPKVLAAAAIIRDLQLEAIEE